MFASHAQWLRDPGAETPEPAAFFSLDDSESESDSDEDANAQPQECRPARAASLPHEAVSQPMSAHHRPTISLVDLGLQVSSLLRDICWGVIQLALSAASAAAVRAVPALQPRAGEQAFSAGLCVSATRLVAGCWLASIEKIAGGDIRSWVISTKTSSTCQQCHRTL